MNCFLSPFSLCSSSTLRESSVHIHSTMCTIYRGNSIHSCVLLFDFFSEFFIFDHDDWRQTVHRYFQYHQKKTRKAAIAVNLSFFSGRMHATLRTLCVHFHCIAADFACNCLRVAWMDYFMAAPQTTKWVYICIGVCRPTGCVNSTTERTQISKIVCYELPALWFICLRVAKACVMISWICYYLWQV